MFSNNILKAFERLLTCIFTDINASTEGINKNGTVKNNVSGSKLNLAPN